ncbi:putative RNA methyltransferase [Vallicoccus soli]|uniref:Methyltransferase domain-containing protein n=1 Tax=Vallicoccus soli TaxID=2339232 RepID=A0A3A3YUZ3_9ACTN|nr:methyltransferase domain-containing protein [Vallicoccus soli]RJK95320.1 methyltransferase domain-containing protein [Vallicoccus soli]
MLPQVVALLRCPVCVEGLAAAGPSLRCPRGHAFDVARQGYANLLPGGAATGTADTAAMVAARAELLGAGHYAAVSGALAGAAAAVDAPGAVVDVGAGTGHHLAAVLDACPARVGLALDLSKHAARRAARAHPRAGAVVADAWARLPVRDGAAAVVLDVFAPRNGAEAARVLAPGGALLVVTPTPRHLAEVRGALGMLEVGGAKEERLGRALAPHLDEEASRDVEADLDLGRDDLVRLAAMGPSAFHATPAELAARAARLPGQVRVGLSVRLSVWRRR